MKRNFLQKMLGKQDSRVYYDCNTTNVICGKHPFCISKLCARKMSTIVEQAYKKNPNSEIDIHFLGFATAKAPSDGTAKAPAKEP